MSFVENQELIETLVPHCAYPTFGESIRIGRLIWCQHDFNPFGRKNGVKGSSELGIAIMDQKPRVAILLLELPGQLSGLLGYPS